MAERDNDHGRAEALAALHRLPDARYVTGPLIFVKNVHDVAYNEMVVDPHARRRAPLGPGARGLGRHRRHPGLRGHAGHRRRQDRGPLPRRGRQDRRLARAARPRAQRHRQADRRRRADHPREAPRHHRRADQPVHARAAGRLHRDRHLRHRRAEHAGARPEAPDLLGLRPSGQRARGADHPPGAGQVGRGVRHRLRRDGHHPPRGRATSCSSSRRRARSSASSSS